MIYAAKLDKRNWSTSVGNTSYGYKGVCACVCVGTLGVGHEAVERREVACVARGDSEGVELKEAESRGSTWTPREIIESGICNAGTQRVNKRCLRQH